MTWRLLHLLEPWPRCAPSSREGAHSKSELAPLLIGTFLHTWSRRQVVPTKGLRCWAYLQVFPVPETCLRPFPLPRASLRPFPLPGTCLQPFLQPRVYLQQFPLQGTCWRPFQLSRVYLLHFPLPVGATKRTKSLRCLFLLKGFPFLVGATKGTKSLHCWAHLRPSRCLGLTYGRSEHSGCPIVSHHFERIRLVLFFDGDEHLHVLPLIRLHLRQDRPLSRRCGGHRLGLGFAVLRLRFGRENHGGRPTAQAALPPRRAAADG
mmetsp:Transcript_27867/g.89742  ORF Transcript_27867/g.89742 Transcript_27867/m.89742 type:complete len:263 (+) Transcript_27867:318-1106(+)